MAAVVAAVVAVLVVVAVLKEDANCLGCTWSTGDIEWELAA